MGKNEGLVPANSHSLRDAISPENIRDSDYSFVVTVRPSGKAISIRIQYFLPTLQKAVSHKIHGKEESKYPISAYSLPPLLRLKGKSLCLHKLGDSLFRRGKCG